MEFKNRKQTSFGLVRRKAPRDHRVPWILLVFSKGWAYSDFVDQARCYLPQFQVELGKVPNYLVSWIAGTPEGAENTNERSFEQENFTLKTAVSSLLRTFVEIIGPDVFFCLAIHQSREIWPCCCSAAGFWSIVFGINFRVGPEVFLAGSRRDWQDHYLRTEAVLEGATTFAAVECQSVTWRFKLDTRWTLCAASLR